MKPKDSIINNPFKFKTMKRICLSAAFALTAALMAGSCSKEQSACGCGDDGAVIPVTFTMNTPAGEAVPYGGGGTRATHDVAEWTIHKLALYVYAVDNDDKGTFLRSYSTDATGDQAISIVPNGAGTYTFTLKAPVSDLKARQRFVFVANDAYATPSVGESQDELQNKLATTVLTDSQTSDLLAPDDKGIAMSGIAQSGSQDVITITPGVKCEVHLKRIVARVDVQNNTPNLVIRSMELQNAAPKGYLFPHDPVTAADEGYITLGKNANVDLGDSYDDQTELKKAFYLYERHNEEGNGSTVKITYRINNTDGEVIIPFRKTSDDKAYVDITRNTLYTIVLGNGEPVVTNEVKFTLKVEDWNVVDMDEAVDPDDDAQRALNAALKVNRFTATNVLSLNKDTKKVTFYESNLAFSREDCPTTSYFSYNWLSGQDDGTTSPNGANNGDGAVDLRNAIFTDDAGNKYKIPTEGELALLVPIYNKTDDEKLYHPYWNDNVTTNTSAAIMSTDEFDETIYLTNNSSFNPDTNGESVTGKSQLKAGALVETVHYFNGGEGESDDPQKYNYNIRPVYGIRFKGSSEYAAYRWTTCKIADNPLERYFSIKIKALSADSEITIDDVARESYWKNGYIEYKFATLGEYRAKPAESQEPDNCVYRGMCCYMRSSSINDNDDSAYLCAFYAGMHIYSGSDSASTLFPLRLVKVEE